MECPARRTHARRTHARRGGNCGDCHRGGRGCGGRGCGGLDTPSLRGGGAWRRAAVPRALRGRRAGA
eukprot:4858905-Prymnesium_polylepis.1